jgi:hypothetical protein
MAMSMTNDPLVLFAAIILSALSLVVRYYRASGVERQQLKWFALAGGEEEGLLDPAGIHALQDLLGTLLTGEVRVAIKEPVDVVEDLHTAAPFAILAHSTPFRRWLAVGLLPPPPEEQATAAARVGERHARTLP